MAVLYSEMSFEKGLRLGARTRIIVLHSSPPINTGIVAKYAMIGVRDWGTFVSILDDHTGGH